jgi:hypothetical protein
VPSAAESDVTNARLRVARGGAFGHGPLTVQSRNHIVVQPTERGGDLGFRPVRTLP